MRRSRVLRLLSLASFGFLGAGCSTNSTVQVPAAVAGISGSVHGGQQPVSGATIQLYAVGTSGDGSAATPLLTTIVTTDANGNFSITGLYTCPSASTLVYITATGGNPGSGITNLQLALLAALGPCGSLTPSTFISINEITTVAAVYALAPYMTSFSGVGSASSDGAALANRFTYAGYFANTATGTTPGPNLPAGNSVPIAQVNTIADLLGSCINSLGGVSGDTSVCGQFFSLSLPIGATPPTDAIGALLNLAKNPTLNTAALYNLISPQAPFQPIDAVVPPDFSFYLIVPSTFTVLPSSIAFGPAIIGFTQPNQTITVTNGTSLAIDITSAKIVGVNASDFALVSNPSSDCTYSVPANSTCTYTISFVPLAAGGRNAYFVLANSSPNPDIAIVLSGTGTAGAAGPVTLTPSTLYFGQGSHPQTATLTNNGSTVLTINSITVYPIVTIGPYGLSYTCGPTLAAMSSCTITYRPGYIYTPPTTATLTVVDDASTGPQTITLVYNSAL